MPRDPNWDDELNQIRRIPVNAAYLAIPETASERMCRLVAQEFTSVDEVIAVPAGESEPTVEPVNLRGRRVVCEDVYHEGGVHPHEAYCVNPRLATDENIAAAGQWWQEHVERQRREQAEQRRRDSEASEQRRRNQAVLRERYAAANRERFAAMNPVPGRCYTFTNNLRYVPEDCHQLLPYDFRWGVGGYADYTIRVMYVTDAPFTNADGVTETYPTLHVELIDRQGNAHQYPGIPPVLLNVRAPGIPRSPMIWPDGLMRREQARVRVTEERPIDLSDHDDDDDDEMVTERSCDCGACQNLTEPDPFSFTRRTSNSLINDYGYKPPPRFHGDGPVFLGAELEIETGGAKTRVARRVLADWDAQRVYLKTDGSIDDGFEIVTHPMSYDYIRANVDVERMDAWRRLGARAEDNCGLHVHVSRDGFTDSLHQYRWMKLIYRNRGLVEHVARRRDSNYARFSPPDHQHAKWMKFYAKGGVGGERYQAINAGNAHTFEMRVFASTLKSTEFMAALALADASVEYTRGLSTHEILTADGWSAGRFADYVSSFDKYRELSDMIAQYRG